MEDGCSLLLSPLLNDVADEGEEEEAVGVVDDMQKHQQQEDDAFEEKERKESKEKRGSKEKEWVKESKTKKEEDKGKGKAFWMMREETKENPAPTFMPAEEADGLLREALKSSASHPICLDWLVPLLNYKHISSLTTHLKRHFQKDVDYMKISSGPRAYTIYITIKCFAKICQYARPANRKAAVKPWLVLLGKSNINTASDNTPRTTQNMMSSKKHGDAQDTDKGKDVDIIELDLLSSSSAPAFLNNPSSAPMYLPLPLPISSQLPTYYTYPHTPTFSTPPPKESISARLPQIPPPMSLPPQLRVNNFPNVNILSKRKYEHKESQWPAEKKQVTEETKSTRINLQTLSKLALGLK